MEMRITIVASVLAILLTQAACEMSSFDRTMLYTAGGAAAGEAIADEPVAGALAGAATAIVTEDL